jgi:5-methylcytosine-specific restriction endonuclease McrA
MPDENTRRARYVAYINSAEWQRKRRQALERAGDRCQVCNKDRGLDVHHRTYERFGSERLDDLTVLCRACHSLFHETRKARANQPKKAKKPQQASKKVRALTAENERLHAVQARNRQQRADAAAARAPRVVVLRPGEGVRQ